MNFYSQHGEDRWIVENVAGLPDRGVFVEVGAWDGVTLSNSRHFEEKGWTGLCVEPDPRSWEALLRNRRCEVFLGAAGVRGGVSFGLHPRCPSLSGFGRFGLPARVPVLPLRSILDAYGIGPIDLLSIDTEGTELEVWGSGGFGLMPRVVVIEWNTHGRPGNEAAIVDEFSRFPYRLRHRTEGNLIFVSE